MFFRILSFFYWLICILLGLIFFPIAVLIWLLTSFWDKKRVVQHLFTCFWASVYNWINPLWFVKIKNRKLIKSKEVKVIISNHESVVDIFILYMLFTHFKWVSKIEVFKIPLIGWNMRFNKYIQLKRGSLKANAAMIQDSIKALKEGSSVFIFPEGTRTNDGSLNTFKKGAFEIALKAKVPIQPVYLSGTRTALRKHGFSINGPTKVIVDVKEPVPYEEFKDLTSSELKEKFRAMYEKYREEDERIKK